MYDLWQMTKVQEEGASSPRLPAYLAVEQTKKVRLWQPLIIAVQYFSCLIVITSYSCLFDFKSQKGYKIPFQEMLFKMFFTL